MFKDKEPIEMFHFLARATALSGDGYCEACDFFEEEKDKNNLNLDEKIIMACCLLNISLAAAGRGRKEELEEKQKSIRDFYFATYDLCAPGTRDYMRDYEERMNEHKKMFKDLQEYIERVYDKPKTLRKKLEG